MSEFPAESWFEECFGLENNFPSPKNYYNDPYNLIYENYINNNCSDFNTKNYNFDFPGQNSDEKINTKNNNNDWNNNSSSLQDNNNNNLIPSNINQNFDYNQNKSTTPRTETILGKTIYTSSYLIDKKCKELGIKRGINYENLKNIKLIGKKRCRRTKEEIENNKKNEKPPEQKDKKKGRRRNDYNINDSGDEIPKHDKSGDDNMAKKANCGLINSVNNWINNSFLDSSGKFINYDKKSKKKNENNFLKINPNIITNNIKRKDTLENIEKTFKDILSSQISKKYKHFPENYNKILIDRILKENKQDFVIYILNMKFIDGMNYYNGINTDEAIINHFKEKYDISLIRQFINNFKKIDDLLEHLAKEEKDIKKRNDYMERFIIFCLNYKQSFEVKNKRGDNKKKKNDNNK